MPDNNAKRHYILCKPLPQYVQDYDVEQYIQVGLYEGELLLTEMLIEFIKVGFGGHLRLTIPHESIEHIHAFQDVLDVLSSRIAESKKAGVPIRSAEELAPLIEEMGITRVY